eukprot:CAMPEP_0169104894 /NCGR_PEP_ID=MMETSP1015-20121227/23504_1 /TAXON_ID=342587 /ORGANISM="Karlodinium micrum, Strain CCMP2283" /LENGTH=75 /DNA_ID=CAMNT_0009166213 /DNA_START=113 /DNA_END=340 /DNA_ORIENTATION=-
MDTYFSPSLAASWMASPSLAQAMVSLSSELQALELLVVAPSKPEKESWWAKSSVPLTEQSASCTWWALLPCCKLA